MFDKRINIFTGHFGSGKTEVAVNYVLKLSEIHKKTAIVDFDIVNPYFRTADAKEVLERHGLWVITPLYANTNVDVPALPPQINTLFDNKEYKAVFDVGGDDLGAKAVSRYREEILENDYELFFVINARRPMTNTVDKIAGMILAIEESARIKVTRLVNNTNVLQYTVLEDIMEGQKLIASVSKQLDIPIGFISGMSEVLKQGEADNGGDVLCMQKLIKLPWD